MPLAWFGSTSRHAVIKTSAQKDVRLVRLYTDARYIGVSSQKHAFGLLVVINCRSSQLAALQYARFTSMVTHHHHRIAIPVTLVPSCHHHYHHLHFHLHPNGDDDFILNVASNSQMAIAREALGVGECRNPNPII